jgi:pimeloyl-ACP methyl ester carboxylesterase
MQTVKLGDVSLAVRDEGTGQPILFVHGFPLDHSMWEAQIERFKRTFRVIAPDLRGFGKSEVTNGTVTMQAFADDLAALLTALRVHEPIVLCGLSMGGYVALQFQKRYSDRLRGLVFCDTRATPDTAQAAGGRRTLAQEVLEKGPAPAATAMLPKLVGENTKSERREVLAELERMIRQTAPGGIAAALHGMADRPDMRGELPQIQVPCLVLVGEDDVITTPEEMKGMAEAIPNADYVVISDSGHMAPMENPDVVNEVLERFLAKVCG